MEARNRFSVLGYLDGDATIGALRAALLGANASAVGLPSVRVGASSSAVVLPSARVGASSSSALGLPSAPVGATSSALGLPTALPGASSSSNRGKDVSSEVEDRHFGLTVDPALLLDPADTEGGWTKAKPAAKHRAPRAVAAPHPAPVIPAAAEPEDELEEIRLRLGAPRMRDITKWILVTAVSRAGLCGRSYGHQI